MWVPRVTCKPGVNIECEVLDTSCRSFVPFDNTAPLNSFEQDRPAELRSREVVYAAQFFA